MVLTLIMAWILSLAYFVFFFLSLANAVLYALELLEMVNGENDFYCTIRGIATRALKIPLNLVQGLLSNSNRYDYSPFIVCLILYILPQLIGMMAILGGIKSLAV